MTDGNGVTRREFEELKAEIGRLRREGSEATRILARDVVDVRKDVDALTSNFTWAIRGIVSVIFLVLGAILISYASGALGPH